MPTHELNRYMKSVTSEMEDDYRNILVRVKDDPGTAGDQGEENWSELFEEWLPPIFQIVTKGRILGHDGSVSNQVDVIILRPEYPKKLLNKKYYLAGGVIAAFECKITLRSRHFEKFFKNSVTINRLPQKRSGTPYKELHSPILYGLLAHSHEWNKEKSKPFNNIKRLINENDNKFITHPIEMPSIICISDLLTIISSKSINLGAKNIKECAMTTYFACPDSEKNRIKNVMPIGTLLSSLFHKLAWEYPTIQPLANYLHAAKISDVGSGSMRTWPDTIFSKEIRNRVINKHLSNKIWDEWCFAFM